jgi:hypothetical protein
MKKYGYLLGYAILFAVTATIAFPSSHLSCSSQGGGRIILQTGIGLSVYGSSGLARAAVSGEPRRRRLCM